MEYVIKIEALAEIQQAAAQFLELLKQNETKCVAFYGAMGSGKTTFIKALCKELGVIDVVNSPTFAIVNEYRTDEQGTIYHFDFYRIEKVEEVFDMGYEDYLYSQEYCLLEWPELIENILPPHCLKAHLKQTPSGARELRFSF